MRVLAFAAVLLLIGDVRGDDPLALTPAEFSSRAPAWSPDGTRVAFESDRSGSWDISLLTVETGTIQRITSSASDERFPTWSPDGLKLAYVWSDESGSDLEVLNLKSGETQRIEREGAELFPHWSPDGQSIVYTSVLDDILRIEVYSFAEESFSNLLETPGRDVWPRWSPDGSRITFFSRRDTKGQDDEVYVLDVVSRNITRLTSGPGHDFCPGWSPDGTQIVFVNVQPDGSRWLQIVDDQGQEGDRLSRDFYRVTEPAWSPDNSSIVYTARSTESAGYRLYLERL